MVRRKSLYRGALVVASGALVLAVALPLWQPLLIAAVLAAAGISWHDRLSHALRGRRQLAAAIFVAALGPPAPAPPRRGVSRAGPPALPAVPVRRPTLPTP